MNPVETILRGIHQALRARQLIVLLWLLNLAVALPAALLVADGLADSFGASRVAERMQQGFDMNWYAEHEARASGLMATFRPTLAGPGVVLENLDAWLTGRLFRSQGEVRMPGVGQPRSGGNGLEFPGLLIFGVAYGIIWALVLGGVLDRLARPGKKA